MKTQLLNRPLCVAFMLAAVGAATHSFAWSESGHHLVALLAFDQLGTNDKKELLRILSFHPRFVEDFTPSEKIRDTDRFRVGTAAYWPDIARKQPRYDRPTWHYQLGATLTLGEVSLLKAPTTPGSLPAAANFETQELHIAQAEELCTRVFRDKTSLPADRAISLCWIAHLVGDAHQPCHAGSLYAAKIFPEGDRGANSIATYQKINMHALWDSLLGGRYNEGDVRRRASEITHGPEYEAIGREILSKPESLDTLTWLEESRDASKRYVYTHEVLKPLEAAMEEGGELPMIHLSEAYLRQAGDVARRRAAEASFRLAAIWREGLNVQTSNDSAQWLTISEPSA